MKKGFSLKNFIAEIGVNHENNMGHAKRMIRECAQVGIGCVKFQSYKSSKLAAPYSPSYWDTAEEPTKSQSELFSRYDLFGQAEYQELYEYCKTLNIEFLSTPFDVDYVETLSPFVDRYKVASVDLTNYVLLEAIAKQIKPIVLSVGASTITEIQETVEFLNQLGASDITLLHCVINYPTKIENAGLGNICMLIDHFPNLKIGYSDHTVPRDSHNVLPLAIAMGAEVIEKHYTFDKSLPGNDHYHSFDKTDLQTFAERVSSLNKAIGPVDLAHQQKAIKNARRGLYATRDLRAGHILAAEDLCPLRPQLDFISPKYVNNLIGKELVVDIVKSQGIKELDVLNFKRH